MQILQWVWITSVFVVKFLVIYKWLRIIIEELWIFSIELYRWNISNVYEPNKIFKLFQINWKLKSCAFFFPGRPIWGSDHTGTCRIQWDPIETHKKYIYSCDRSKVEIEYQGCKIKQAGMYGRCQIEINSQSLNLDLLLRADGNRRLIDTIEWCIEEWIYLSEVVGSSDPVRSDRTRHRIGWPGFPTYMTEKKHIVLITS